MGKQTHAPLSRVLLEDRVSRLGEEIEHLLDVIEEAFPCRCSSYTRCERCTVLVEYGRPPGQR